MAALKRLKKAEYFLNIIGLRIAVNLSSWTWIWLFCCLVTFWFPYSQFYREPECEVLSQAGDPVFAEYLVFLMACVQHDLYHVSGWKTLFCCVWKQTELLFLQSNTHVLSPRKWKETSACKHIYLKSRAPGVRLKMLPLEYLRALHIIPLQLQKMIMGFVFSSPLLGPYNTLNCRTILSDKKTWK